MGELKRENIHKEGRILRDEKEELFETMRALNRVKNKMPVCPECGLHCIEWFENYFTWILEDMLGPGGYMSMFIALLIRDDGTIEFTKDELKKARLVTKVIAESTDNDEVWRAVITEMIVEESEEDPDWPSVLG